MAVGSLLFLLGNGAVVWSEQRIPSGVAALIVAMVPLWIVLLEWLLPHGRRPDWRVGLGLLLGTAGLFLLLGPAGASLGEPIDLLGGSVLLLGTFCWAAGSLLTRHGENPSPPALATALQMLSGGVGLMAVAAVHGDFQAFDAAHVTLRSWLAVVYLVVFGALIGFSSYAYLLRTVRPTQVATYAYVNPVVAVFLGWVLAGEVLTARSLTAMVVIVAAVAFITSSRAFRPSPRPQAPTSPRGV
jgi:drug/metabolite transporter (DMT)-like permease